MALLRWTFLAIISLLLLLLLLRTSASASFSDEPTTYIVHMDPSAKPTPFSEHHAWYSTELSSAIADDTNTPFPSILYTYTTALHGFSAQLTPIQLRRLRHARGFLSAYPDRLVHLDTTRSPTFLGLTSSGALLPTANYGDSITIAIIDTGIYPESLSFSDSGIAPPPPKWRGRPCEFGNDGGSCNRKLVGARFFSKGFLAKYPNATATANSTRDTDGHGTHTASTAAGSFVPGANFFGYANGTARGVAPRAHIAAYKVVWENAGYLSDVIAGIDQAVADGVDIISISLGVDDEPLYRDPVAIAAFGAVEKGISVVTSSGNAGPSLLTLHNGIPWTLTVGASTIDRKFSASVELGDGTVVAGTALYMGSAAPPVNSTLLPVDRCNNKTLLQAEGKIVVCRAIESLGHTWLAVKHSNVTGAVFITDDILSEFFEMMTFPGVILTPKEGAILSGYLNRTVAPVGTFRFGKTVVGIRPAPAVAAYSARGPSASCPYVLKPDVVAPGAMILAAWPPNIPVSFVEGKPVRAGFNVLSGSSMSCPHAAGVAALLKAAHPDWTPAAIRSAIMTTADTVDNTGKPIGDIGLHGAPAGPLDMGAGHVNPNRAADPGLVYEVGLVDYARLLCAMNYKKKQIRTITRGSKLTSCANASLDLNYPSFVVFSKGTRVVSEFRRTVTNVGGGRSVYRAEVEGVDGFRIAVTPEKLVFGGKKGEKVSFVVRLEGKVDGVDVHGALTWVEVGGRRRRVRSPIVATAIAVEQL